MHSLLNFLHQQNINSFLDIGANNGDFSRQILNTFPNIKIFCIEANENCKNDLIGKNLPHMICCLSDTEKDIDFFISKLGDGKNTGASYYKELTPYYAENNYNTLKVKTKTLDTIFTSGEIFEFIKLDTQGSEIDIIRGGLRLVKKSKFIMAEVAVLRYNECAPMKEDVFSYLNSIHYDPHMKIEEHRYPDGTIFQEDWIFKNNAI